MTREEAILILTKMIPQPRRGDGKSTTHMMMTEALIIAIEALEQEPKIGHWIDADGENAICSCCNRLNHLYGNYCKHYGAKMED